MSQNWPRPFRSLRHRDFRYYWFGQVVSQIGTWMAIVAQGWVVYRLTDSAFMLGVVNFAGLLPVVPFSLLAGVLSDRFSKRRIIIITETVLVAQSIIMAVLLWLDAITAWYVILLSFVLGAAAAIEQPARLAFVSDVVGDEDLSNAVALNSSAYNTARIIGPAIAGIIIAPFGEAFCFLVNGITYFAVIIALLFVRDYKARSDSKDLRVVGSLFDGLKYIKGQSVIMILLFIVSVASFLTIPYMILMPVFAKDILKVGADGLGFLMTAVGIGAIIGAMVVAYLQSGYRGRWLVIANIAGPILLVCFSFSKSFALSLFLVILVGASNSIRLTLANSLIQLTTEKNFHGRVMSIFNLLFNGMSRLGALAIGGFAEIITVPLALGSGAFLSAVVGILVAWRAKDVVRLK